MTTPVYGFHYPTLASIADGPDGFQDLALDVEATLQAKTLTSFTPVWIDAAGGVFPPTSPATMAGKYRVWGGRCFMQINTTFGPSTTGGRGALVFNTPLPAANTGFDQYLFCRLSVPSVGFFQGIANIPPGAQVIYPGFPVSSSRSDYNNFASADAAANPGTGFPAAPGAFTVQNGGAITIVGSYALA
jgi:hypothetical protein